MHDKLVRIAACLAGIGLSIFVVAWQPTTPVIGEWEFALLMVKATYALLAFVCLWIVKDVFSGEKPFRPVSTLPILLFLYPVSLPIAIGLVLLRRRTEAKYLNKVAALEAKMAQEETQGL